MTKEKIIRRTEDFCDAVNDMRTAMTKTQEKEQERLSRVTEFKKKFPDATYLEPKERRPTGGNRCPEYERQHGGLEYLLEYVVGIFESQMITGFIEFDLGTIPGEDYCRWKIPVNKPVGVPRFVAQHMAQGLGWKEMKPLGRDNQPKDFYEDEMMTPFGNFEYKKRGHFHPINAY